MSYVLDDLSHSDHIMMTHSFPAMFWMTSSAPVSDICLLCCLHFKVFVLYIDLLSTDMLIAPLSELPAISSQIRYAQYCVYMVI